MTRRILRLFYGSSGEDELVTISPSPGGIAEATEATAAMMRERRGADWAQWLDGEQEQLAILEMARETQMKRRHKLACEVGRCAPGCHMTEPA